MLKFSLILMLAGASFAEKQPAAGGSGTAPPKVDAALRARVNQFYQYEVDGKFRQAEELVAKDTKDFFVGSSKPTFVSFNIKSIEFSDKFTKARVMVNVERMVPIEGFLGHPVPGVVPSRWKLEKGKWCWYVLPEDFTRTPFGNPFPGSTGTAAPAGFPGAQPGAPPPVPGTPPGATSKLPLMPDMGAIASGLRPDKTSVVLKPGAASSDQVSITNPTTRTLTLVLTDPKVPGLSLKLDRTDVAAGSRVVLTVQSSGTVAAAPLTVALRVQETNQIIPVRISFGDK